MIGGALKPFQARIAVIVIEDVSAEANYLVLKGATIRRASVIGAGSVKSPWMYHRGSLLRVTRQELSMSYNPSKVVARV